MSRSRATGVTYGLALSSRSSLQLSWCGIFGVALGALSMLGTLTVTLTRNVRGVSGSMCNLPVPTSLTEAIFCRGHGVNGDPE